MRAGEAASAAVAGGPGARSALRLRRRSIGGRPTWSGPRSPRPADRTGIATHPGSDDINGWVRNAAGDRLLSDAEWTEVVEDLMDRTGIRGCDDPVAATGWPSARPATTSTSPRF